MILPPRDAETFFKLHGLWTFYLNEQLRVYPTFADTGEMPKFTHPKREKIRNAGLQTPQLLQTFLQDNPFGLADSELTIFSAWRFGVCDTFYLTEHRPDYSVFVSALNPHHVYGVIGLTDELSTLVKYPVPVQLTTMLLPWKEWWINDILKATKTPLPAELATPLAELTAAAQADGWLRRHPRDEFVAPPELAAAVAKIRDWQRPTKKR